MFDASPISGKQLVDITLMDPILQKLKARILKGWRAKLDDPGLEPYWPRRQEVSFEKDAILRGQRIVIPERARNALLAELHGTHQEITETEAFIRTLIWWPGIDRDLEQRVRSCPICQQAPSSPPSQEPLPWPSSAEPWTRIHMDYAGPIEGKMILVVVYSHSGWIEAIPVKSATAEVTVVHLRYICARFGLPTCIVTDNAITDADTGAIFQEFVKRSGIRHMRTAPYHPQSNGPAERAVRSVKEALKKLTDGPLEIRLQRWLHNHRRTPSAAHGGKAPAEMLFNFLPRSRLDIIKADVFKNQKTTQQDVDIVCNLEHLSMCANNAIDRDGCRVSCLKD
ncbi:uncharacterized protein K02A2.6-like [Ornithodoros turicata]|uniref:uncharacterized protein K02A2.6-like n=1 Tax=Ornithodoros turicata TaxID=34597 RepID=UPI0031390F8A